MTLEEALAAEALLVLGGVAEADSTLLLIAPDTRRFWSHLTASPEGRDGAPDRVDRWSTRVLGSIAESYGAQAIFPFGGPPYHPFLAWAQQSGRVFQSPIGPLVSADMGLWVSFRGALRLPGRHSFPAPAAHPCPTCAQPCRSACPVDAFAAGTYDFEACRAHIGSPHGAECLTGCLARKACPVGREFTLPHEQAMHHMASFRGLKP
ncbi:ferredoxin [Pontivivens insulae]|uniref:4Fe-4S ferredoxin-type domain-containing protein n=1 Tax=Pontivivens insulae TaxID=1639689 RepID=A0A2R8AEH8_9RHOB|nr:ferredoxin [Pontivivens insulae]RED14378.1 hypothetical protein DFR53_1737 [Pontivivens insulae]SPF30455.1 hypothetical protein POI8812_02793 [Pontivivens insulae]